MSITLGYSWRLVRLVADGEVDEAHGWALTRAGRARAVVRALRDAQADMRPLASACRVSGEGV